MRKFQQGERLTVRELEILELIAQGQSAKEAAIALRIMPRTVECHLDAVRMKLGARNRTHVVAIAIGAGILPFETMEHCKATTYGSGPSIGHQMVGLVQCPS